MKKIILIALICGCATTMGVIFTACKDDPTPPKVKEPISTLVGTKWKLVAFVDVENNTSREPEIIPGFGDNFRGYFTLDFDTDSTVSGRSSLNDVVGEYNADYSLSTFKFYKFSPITFANELGDGWLYVETMNNVKSFSFTKEELKLYYNDKKDYLLFERREQ